MRSIGSPAPSDVDSSDEEDIHIIYPEGLLEEGEAVLAELNEKTQMENDEIAMDIDEQPLSPTPILPSQEHSNPLAKNSCHEKTNHSIRNPFAMWPASNNTNFVRQSQKQSTPLRQPAGQTIRQVLSSFDDVVAQRPSGHHQPTMQATIHNSASGSGTSLPASWSHHQTSIVPLWWCSCPTSCRPSSTNHAGHHPQ